MNTDEFKVPYGRLATGKLVKASAASKGIRYVCPGCDDQLILRAGPVMAQNFAHKVGGACTGESVLHKTAKALLVQTVREHVERPRITLRCVCATCRQPFTKPLPSTAFDDAFEEISIERRICDVVTFSQGDPNLAIEVLVTHAVDQIKADDLTLFWIELLATEIIDDPAAWRPQQARLKPQRCSKCKVLQGELKNLQEKSGLHVHPSAASAHAPYPPYLVAKDMCYSCKEPMPVYWWQGVPFCQRAPPDPRPRTLQFRFSKMYGGKYWMNTCASCGAPSGDNFLFLQSNSPLGHLPLVETEEIKVAKLKQSSKIINRMTRHF